MKFEIKIWTEYLRCFHNWQAYLPSLDFREKQTLIMMFLNLKNEGPRTRLMKVLPD